MTFDDENTVAAAEGEVTLNSGSAGIASRASGRHSGARSTTTIDEFARVTVHRRVKHATGVAVLSPLVKLLIRFGPVPHRRRAFADAKT